MRLPVAVALLLLTGCVTTVAEIREQPPQRTGSVAGDYRALAHCTVDELRASPSSPWMLQAGNLTYELVTREPEGFARITGLMQVTGRPAPVVELLLRDQPPGRVRAELRWAYWWGDRIGDPVWAMIGRCARAPIAATAP